MSGNASRPPPVGKLSSVGSPGENLKALTGCRNKPAKEGNLNGPIQLGRTGHLNLIPTIGIHTRASRAANLYKYRSRRTLRESGNGDNTRGIAGTKKTAVVHNGNRQRTTPRQSVAFFEYQTIYHPQINTRGQVNRLPNRRTVGRCQCLSQLLRPRCPWHRVRRSGNCGCGNRRNRRLWDNNRKGLGCLNCPRLNRVRRWGAGGGLSGSCLDRVLHRCDAQGGFRKNINTGTCSLKPRKHVHFGRLNRLLMNNRNLFGSQ